MCVSFALKPHACSSSIMKEKKILIDWIIIIDACWFLQGNKKVAINRYR